MKNLENQLKILRGDYGDKIPSNFRNKLDRYILFLKQLPKNSTFKHLSHEPQDVQQQKNDILILQPIKQQIKRLKKQIEAYIKLQMTDYESFLWKIGRKDSAKIFQKTGIAERKLPQYFSLLKIKDSKKNKLSFEDIENAKINFDYPILQTKTKDLIDLGTQLIYTSNNFCQQNFDKRMIHSLLTTISYGYNILSYHHFSHAFSVFLMFFQCKSISNSFVKNFSEFQIFFAYIAALCHDMSHPGVNSAYQIKKKSNISVLYNNESVLENMHISQFYRIIRENPDMDILSKLKSPAQREQAKRLINRLILCTDVQLHMSNIKKLTNIQPMQNSYSFDQKQIILQNVFHACDIGNPCLDFQTYMDWAVLVTYQFDEQAKLQRKQGLEITPNFQYVDIQTHYKRQIGFINFLVYPLWKQLAVFFPQFKILQQRIKNNKKQLQNLASK